MSPIKLVVLIVCAVVFTGLAWFAAPAIDKDKDALLTGGQKQEVEQLIGEYIRENPTIIVEAIQNLQQRERQAREQQAAQNLSRFKSQLENDPSSPFVGKQDANATIVEFFDYRCPYCKRMLPTIQKLLREDANIRYVFKEFPILSAESKFASEVALATWNFDRDRYLDLHTRLMGAKGGLTKDRVMRIAASTGLDISRLRLELKSPKIVEELKNNSRLAQSLGITGTPAFVIGSRIIPGATDYATIKKAIAEARGNSG